MLLKKMTHSTAEALSFCNILDVAQPLDTALLTDFAHFKEKSMRRKSAKPYSATFIKICFLLFTFKNDTEK